MANHLYKLWYKKDNTGQLDLFDASSYWIGPMFMPGEDSEDAIRYLYEMRSDLTIKVTGKWRKDGDRYR